MCGGNSSLQVAGALVLPPGRTKVETAGKEQREKGFKRAEGDGL